MRISFRVRDGSVAAVGYSRRGRLGECDGVGVSDALDDDGEETKIVYQHGGTREAFQSRGLRVTWEHGEG